MAKTADIAPGESALIARVVALDDHHAFAELLRLHQSPVRQFLRRLTGGDWGHADDLAQETFLKAYRHIASYRASGRFLSWLFRIAWQLYLSEQRGPARISTEVPLSDDIDAGDTNTEIFIERRSFDQLLATLRSDECAALLLHYRHELSHPEIADTMQLPLGSVKSLIRRARLKLMQAHQPNDTQATT